MRKCFRVVAMVAGADSSSLGYLWRNHCSEGSRYGVPYCKMSMLLRCRELSPRTCWFEDVENVIKNLELRWDLLSWEIGPSWFWRRCVGVYFYKSFVKCLMCHSYVRAGWLFSWNVGFCKWDLNKQVEDFAMNSSYRFPRWRGD